MTDIKKVTLPDKERYRSRIGGKETGLFELKNKNNFRAAITNYGARWVSMLLPDNGGAMRDIILGFDTVDGYIRSTEAYYGAIVGRYANRIANGGFSLDGKEYKLAINNPPNHLHGGIIGFHAVVWDVVSTNDCNMNLRYISKDGEEGYPGELTVDVAYHLTEENEMIINFRAVTTKPTVINLTNHAYFNLNGQGSGSILDHLLTINADHYTPIDKNSIPVGSIEPVDGTPFDFRERMRIGARIHELNEQLTNGSGYDHNFVLKGDAGLAKKAAEATGDNSGIRMEVFTTEPGMQLYTGNFMNKENVLKGGVRDGKQEAFCLETQHFPDTPNHPAFPSVVLRPGEEYKSRTSFVFNRP